MFPPLHRSYLDNGVSGRHPRHEGAERVDQPLTAAMYKRGARLSMASLLKLPTRAEIATKSRVGELRNKRLPTPLAGPCRIWLPSLSPLREQMRSKNLAPFRTTHRVPEQQLPHRKG